MAAVAAARPAFIPEVREFAERHGLAGGVQEELNEIMSAKIKLAQQHVTVTVPASISNMGPGLESCGLAVDIWDDVMLEYAATPTLEVVGEGASSVPTAWGENMAVAGAQAAFMSGGRPFPTLRVVCTHRVPFCAGLGGPSASFVGGFLAGSVLCSEELHSLGEPSRCNSPNNVEKKESLADVLAAGMCQDKSTGRKSSMSLETLLQKASARGWNPGNVCPAIYGALQLGLETPNGFRSHRVNVPMGLVCVIFVPDSLQEGRPIRMEDAVDRKAAIFNVGRMALLTNCFCSGNFEMLRRATEETLVSKHTAEQFPHVPVVVQAALEAGATGAFPAGYGPSVVALITGRAGDMLAQSSFDELERGVARAMLSEADGAGVLGRVLIAKPADVGAHVLAGKSALGAPGGEERIVYFQG